MEQRNTTYEVAVSLLPATLLFLGSCSPALLSFCTKEFYGGVGREHEASCAGVQCGLISRDHSGQILAGLRETPSLHCISLMSIAYTTNCLCAYHIYPPVDGITDWQEIKRRRPRRWLGHCGTWSRINTISM
jgi:hypothetical protein